MALIKCAECGIEVSERAPACPKCGAPQHTAPAQAIRPAQRRKTHPVTWAALAALIVALGWMTIQSERESRLPPVPIDVKFRKAMLGPGYVLVLENTSTQPLPLMVSLEHPAINDSRKFDVYVGPRSHVEIGKLNGWITQPGDRITLANANFKSWSGSIP